MVNRYASSRSRALLAVFPALCLWAAAAARAQSTSFSNSISGSLSTPIADSTAESGFNSSFDAITANLPTPDIHVDISDATHSHLLGSTLSPADTAYANAYAETAPHTAALTDAQSVVGANDFYFGGGRRSQAFAAGGLQRYAGTAATRQEMRGSTGAASMAAAFTGAVSARDAFSGRAAAKRGTEAGFSGEGLALPAVQTGPGATQTLAASGAPDESAGFFATDPVLTGFTSGWKTGPELHGDMASPSLEASMFFSEAPVPREAYAFDDGQTPPIRRAQMPGQILGLPPTFNASATGFPDSTKGEAALPTESSAQVSPFNRGVDPNGPRFAPVSDGTVYEPRTRLVPSLHERFYEPKTGSFEAYERRLQRLRISHGMSISQAASAKQDDLRAFQRSQVRRGRDETRDSILDQRAGGAQSELIGKPVIR